MKINPEPLDSIPQEIVAQDRAFWDDYTARLLANPDFRQDYHAKNAFSKLRSSIANVYSFRQMYDHAEYAYRQALQLAPDNQETVTRFCQMLVQLGRHDDAIAVIDADLKLDPNNELIQRLRSDVLKFKQINQRTHDLENEIRRNPNNLPAHQELIRLYADIQNFNKVVEILSLIIPNKNLSDQDFTQYIRSLLDIQRLPDAIRLTEMRLRVDPHKIETQYNLASLLAMSQNFDQAFKELAKAFKLGGQAVAETVQQDPSWEPVRNDLRYQKLMQTGKL